MIFIDNGRNKMPYSVRGKCIYKKDTGKKVGCTKGSVQKYLAALQIHANESMKETIKQIIREELRSCCKDKVKTKK